MKYVLLVIALVCLSMRMNAQGIEFESITFAEALKKAKAENKMVFIDCYTSWCGPCKKLSKYVFTQKEVGDVYNPQFVNIKVDMEKGEGPMLKDKLGVIYYPTLLFLDSEGNTLHKIVGWIDAEGLIENAAMAADPLQQITIMHKRYDSGERDVKFLAAYVKALDTAFEIDKIEPIGKEFIAVTSNEKLMNKYAFAILGYSNLLEYESDTYRNILSNCESLISQEGVEQEYFNGVIRKCINDYLQKTVEECTTVEELLTAIDTVKKQFEAAQVIELDKTTKANEPVPHGDFDGTLIQCFNDYLLRVAKETASIEDLFTATDKIMSEYDYYQLVKMKEDAIDTYYLSHHEFDNWFNTRVKRAEEAKKMDLRMGRGMLVRIAYDISVKPEFAASGLYSKAIDLAKSVLEEDDQVLSAYYCLAYLFKATGDKQEALNYFNVYITKYTALGGQVNDKMIQFKKKIELM